MKIYQVFHESANRTGDPGTIPLTLTITVSIVVILLTMRCGLSFVIPFSWRECERPAAARHRTRTPQSTVGVSTRLNQEVGHDANAPQSFIQTKHVLLPFGSTPAMPATRPLHPSHTPPNPDDTAAAIAGVTLPIEAGEPKIQRPTKSVVLGESSPETAQNWRNGPNWDNGFREPSDSDVRITREPKAEYTREALRLRIQGEVHLAVVFSADGEVRVTRVVRSLGHGLDEAAADAAVRIEFQPARRAGRAVDTEEILVVRFEIA